MDLFTYLEAPHWLEVFMEGPLDQHDWLNYWPLVIEFNSNPSPWRSRGGAGSCNLLITAWYVSGITIIKTLTLIPSPCSPPTSPHKHILIIQEIPRVLESVRNWGEGAIIYFYCFIWSKDRMASGEDSRAWSIGHSTRTEGRGRTPWYGFWSAWGPWNPASKY